MMKCVILVICIMAANAVPSSHQLEKRQSGPDATVTVNGTVGGTRDNPIKINVKEDEGVIVLCYLFTFPDGVDTLSGTCQTMDGTARANTDYEPVNALFSVPRHYPRLYEYITIKDNPYHDGNRKFLFHVQGLSGVDVWVEICIWDDEWEMYGDPHFSVPLLHGGKLCYSIQGIPGLAFNLLSSRHLIINALFIDSVNDPTQATWIGKLAIIPQHVGESQPIIFDSVSQSIKIVGQGYFKPEFLQRVVINETDNIVIKTTHGLNRQAGNPTVTVFLTNPVASFDVTFHKDHLDVNWKMQTNEMDGSHGLLGQFMVNGVEVDSTRKMLIRSGFEPVPVEPSKTWDSPDNCWLAKNVGNQGEGLIEGSIYDYTVSSIESTDLSLNFKYNSNK
ncbi:uncharacterized protein [Dysidea avara]|uniref:uncharacterized protein n=1 Tax=Dysidea avara TaxID=196820 RepID=UPI003318E2E8